MGQEGWNPSTYGLEKHGIEHAHNVYWNLPAPALYEQAVRRGEGVVSHLGPLVVSTGKYTGRSPNDKFVVSEPSSKENVWWGSVNRPFVFGFDLAYIIQRLAQHVKKTSQCLWADRYTKSSSGISGFSPAG